MVHYIELYCDRDQLNNFTIQIPFKGLLCIHDTHVNNYSEEMAYK